MENCAAMVISAAWRRQFDRPVQGTLFAARGAGFHDFGAIGTALAVALSPEWRVFSICAVLIGALGRALTKIKALRLT